MGYPAATGQGTSFAHRRDARPRPCTGGFSGAAKFRSSSLNRNGPLVFFLRAVHGA